MTHLSKHLHDALDEKIGRAIASVESGDVEQATVAFTVAVGRDKDGKMICGYTDKATVTQKGSWRPPTQARLTFDEDEGAAELDNSLAEEGEQLLRDMAGISADEPPDYAEEELEQVAAQIEPAPSTDQLEQLPPEDVTEKGTVIEVPCSTCGKPVQGEWPPNTVTVVCDDCLKGEEWDPGEDEEAAARVRSLGTMEAPDPAPEIPLPPPVREFAAGAMEAPEAPAPKKGGRPVNTYPCCGCGKQLRAADTWGKIVGQPGVLLKRTERANKLKPGEYILCVDCVARAAAEDAAEADGWQTCPHGCRYQKAKGPADICPMCRAIIEYPARGPCEHGTAPGETCPKCQARALGETDEAIGSAAIVDVAACEHGLPRDTSPECPFCAADRDAVQQDADTPTANAAAAEDEEQRQSVTHPCAHGTPMTEECPDCREGKPGADTLNCDRCGSDFPTGRAVLVGYHSKGPEKSPGQMLCPACYHAYETTGEETLPRVDLGDGISWDEGGKTFVGTVSGVLYPPRPDVPQLAVMIDGAEVRIPYATPGLKVTPKPPLPARTRQKRAKKGAGSETPAIAPDAAGASPVQPGRAVAPAADSTDNGHDPSASDGLIGLPVNEAPAPLPLPAAGGSCAACDAQLPADRGLIARKRLGMVFNEEGRWLCPDCSRLLKVVA